LIFYTEGFNLLIQRKFDVKLDQNEFLSMVAAHFRYSVHREIQPDQITVIWPEGVQEYKFSVCISVIDKNTTINEKTRCSHCGSDNFVKSGYRGTKQVCQCQDCGRKFTPKPEPITRAEDHIEPLLKPILSSDFDKIIEKDIDKWIEIYQNQGLSTRLIADKLKTLHGIDITWQRVRGRIALKSKLLKGDSKPGSKEKAESKKENVKLKRAYPKNRKRPGLKPGQEPQMWRIEEEMRAGGVEKWSPKFSEKPPFGGLTSAEIEAQVLNFYGQMTVAEVVDEMAKLGVVVTPESVRYIAKNNSLKMIGRNVGLLHENGMPTLKKDSAGNVQGINVTDEDLEGSFALDGATKSHSQDPGNFESEEGGSE
jgi:hypothetical protein